VRKPKAIVIWETKIINLQQNLTILVKILVKNQKILRKNGIFPSELKIPWQDLNLFR